MPWSLKVFPQEKAAVSSLCEQTNLILQKVQDTTLTLKMLGDANTHYCFGDH